MNRRRTDAAVAVLLAAVLLVGGALAWQADRQRRAVDGSMMGGTMESMHGPDPLWFIAGTLVIATVLAGVYLLIRPEITPTPEGRKANPTDNGPVATSDAGGTEELSERSGSPNPEANPRERVLDLLPEDERRVLEPVLESPGITQVELRDRSGFSKSKVSQTVSGLEERGLLYRERQGRTYRLYPSDDLADTE